MTSMIDAKEHKSFKLKKMAMPVYGYQKFILQSFCFVSLLVSVVKALVNENN